MQIYVYYLDQVAIWKDASSTKTIAMSDTTD